MSSISPLPPLTDQQIYAASDVLVRARQGQGTQGEDNRVVEEDEINRREFEIHAEEVQETEASERIHGLGSHDRQQGRQQSRKEESSKEQQPEEEDDGELHIDLAL